MSSCLICLEPLQDAQDSAYHPKCARRLFGTSKVPVIDVELAKLHTLALAMVGHTSLSGIQRKVSLGIAADSSHLQVSTEGGRYILKPQSQTFPSLAENEHVTMRIAELAGIEVPPCGLVKLPDSSLAYLVKRFDRTDGGGKLMVEDFCQLAEQAPKDKYQGSAEQLAKLVLRFATEPLVESLRLFRLLVFAWWSGNGDMHLKNFSLLRASDGIYRLAPAYDLLCTRLVIPDDQLALSVAGNKKNITFRQWMSLAATSQLPGAAATRAIKEVVASHKGATHLIERSALPEEMKLSYSALLRERTKRLSNAV